VTAAQIASQGFQDAGLNASVVTPDQTTFQANLQNADFDTSLGWAIWRYPWDYFDNIMNSARVDPETDLHR
jgi:ABC-type transport system substrate-binding protein